VKKVHIIGLLVIAAGFAVILGLVSASSRYADFAQAEKNAGKTFHVIGQLNTDKGIEFNPLADANTFSFWMHDEAGREHKVICNGDKPQDFELSEQIVVVGKMQGDVFHASELQMKCPSKYVEEGVEESAP
jgi:cytochrome c-type biogenesis protein CcmE